VDAEYKKYSTIRLISGGGEVAGETRYRNTDNTEFMYHTTPLLKQVNIHILYANYLPPPPSKTKDTHKPT
jgi:hypothetical protein